MAEVKSISSSPEGRRDFPILDFRPVVAKGEVQSQNPAFSLGKAEDYGNGYGEGLSVSLSLFLSRRETEQRSTYARIALYRRHSQYTLLRELGQGRKSLVGTRINVHGFSGAFRERKELNGGDNLESAYAQVREFLQADP